MAVDTFPVQFNFEAGTPRYFKPGFPFYGQVRTYFPKSFLLDAKVVSQYSLKNKLNFAVYSK